ncbi:DUF3471 domain-containing protein [Spirosoma arcticum]
MKRLLIAPFFIGCLLMAGSVNAQTASTTATPGATTTTTTSGVATPDTNQLKQYVGNYTVATGDIKQIIVTVERGKLVGEAVGLGQSGLIPADNTPDAFTVPDPNGGSDVYGSVQFGRNPAGKVSKVVLIVQGQTFEGIRAD